MSGKLPKVTAANVANEGQTFKIRFKRMPATVENKRIASKYHLEVK